MMRIHDHGIKERKFALLLKEAEMFGWWSKFCVR